jgi:hypothetical protein
MRKIFPVVAGLGLSVLLVPVAPSPAYASCASPPRVSQYRFEGTVIAVSNADRTATVRLDDGRTVTVHGSTANGEHDGTSVDRTYSIGVRYEFDPINATDPYQDNICTATHELRMNMGPATPAGTRPQAHTSAEAKPDPAETAWRWAAAVAVLGLVGATVTWWWRRVRRAG